MLFINPRSGDGKAARAGLADQAREKGIEAVILDNHTSIIEGSIGAIPRRVMVQDGDYLRARTLLAEARPAELP